jgi:hypothetical protein
LAAIGHSPTASTHTAFGCLRDPESQTPARERLARSRDAAGDLVVPLGVRLLDEYLEFLGRRWRPNMVLAVAYDLKVFFTVVGKPVRRVRPTSWWFLVLGVPCMRSGRLACG